MTTICHKCGAIFEYPSHLKNRTDYRCSECKRKEEREYYAKNSERVKLRKYKWNNSNKELIKSIKKKSYHKTKDSHRDRKRQSYLKWYHKHNGRDKVYFHKQNRRNKLKAGEKEFFTANEIFERDGWICQICGRKVSLRFRFPHPLSKSLDHIVPIAHGGSHIRKNVRLVHLRCNLKKNASTLADQLRMF